MHNAKQPKRTTILFFTAAVELAVATIATIAMAASTACGPAPRDPIDEPLAPVTETPTPFEPDAEPGTISGPARIELVAVNGAGTVAYIVALEVDDIGAVPLDQPVEAGPELAVRFIELANGAIPVDNALLCERLNNPSPACDDTVTFLSVSPPRAHRGVLTLWTNEDVLTGVIDVQLTEDTNAVGTFSVDI